MFRSLALSMTLLAAVPVQAGAFLSSAGHTVLERPVSSQLEVIGGPRNRGAASYFCAAAEAAAEARAWEDASDNEASSGIGDKGWL